MSLEEPQEKESEETEIEQPEPLGESEGVYERNESGDLEPLPPTTIQTINRTVQYYPVPMGELNRYQELGEEMSMDKLAEILSEKVHRPNRSEQEWLDTDPEIFMAVLNKLVEVATGDEPSTDFHREVQEELKAREGSDGGN